MEHEGTLAMDLNVTDAAAYLLELTNEDYENDTEQVPKHTNTMHAPIDHGAPGGPACPH